MTKITTSRNTASTKRPRRMARPPEHDAAPPATADETEKLEDGSPPSPAPSAVSAPAPTPASPSSTKASLVLELLRRPDGATLTELVAASGWQPHTVRAHLTGLRKKGHAVEKSRRDDATCYRVTEAG